MWAPRWIAASICSLAQSGPQFTLQPSSAHASNVSANGCWRAGPLGHMKPLHSPSFPRCFLGSVAGILENFLGSIDVLLEPISFDGNIARLILDLLFLKAARFGLSFLGTFPVKVDEMFDMMTYEIADNLSTVKKAVDDGEQNL